MSVKLCLSLVVLTWTADMFQVSYSHVYSSSKKVEDMVLREEQILNDLQTAVQELGNETASSFFSKFYQMRLRKVRERQHDSHLLGYLSHPNGVYSSVKQFAAEYEDVRSTLSFTPSPSIKMHLESIATEEDVVGVRQSFVRLQDVYSLNISDMIKGNYFGFFGPELNEADILDIGEAALNDNKWDYAISWLQEALKTSTPQQPTAGLWDFDASTNKQGRVLALLGRSYLRQGNKVKADELYRKARSASANEPDSHVSALERELAIHPEIHRPDPTNEDFRRLCTLQNKLTLKKSDPRISCSYKEVILPYNRFKQELVSVSPYVSLFYEVITDKEIDTIIQAARRKLFRGYIQINGSNVLTDLRISDISFLFDVESPVVLGSLSRKVGGITDLNTASFVRGSSYSAEPFQVVNYGMGGQYGLHYDYFDEPAKHNFRHEDYMAYGGNRLATFLIYLTDVERGGSTIFDKADIAVKPVKKMALFWYNFHPSGELDLATRHAGCPVAIGHKWVTNKWIWHHGNTFTRRCGLTPEATQLDIEPFMRKRWV